MVIKAYINYQQISQIVKVNINACHLGIQNMHKLIKL